MYTPDRPGVLTRRQGLKVLAAAPLALAAGARAQSVGGLPPLPEADVRVLDQGHVDYERFMPAYNARTMKRPRWRAMCATPAGVQRVVDAAAERNIPFAIRAGGHSFEGLSQSDTLVIDVRPLNRIAVDPASRTMSVGAGASLGEIYRAAARAGLCFPAGSCPTVGLAGHIQGGGFGLLSRPLGLASDSLLEVELVRAKGGITRVSAASDPDLFWALQGGGGGTFGAVTSFRLRLHPVGVVHTFVQSFTVARDAAIRILEAWQQWAPPTAREITCLLSLRAAAQGRLSLRLAGKSTGSTQQLVAELARFASLAGQTVSASVRSGSFLEAVDRFSGGWNYESKFSKGKSDFILQPLPAAALERMVDGIAVRPPNELIVILDAYGGAVSDRKNGDTAFAFRDALFCIQYYTSWFNPSQSQRRLQSMRDYHTALRPYMPGFAYVNYCDLDQANWPRSYWRDNLPRLMAVKRATDPGNLFRHAQSVPTM
jgi:FAD/FMN-containing dehydrogenase